MKMVSTQNLTIVNHNGNYYRVIFAFMTKKDAYNLIKNAVIMGQKGIIYKKYVCMIYIILCII